MSSPAVVIDSNTAYQTKDLLSSSNSPVNNINELLEQLSFLTDTELIQAAQSSSTPEEEELMQFLVEKQQREGLTPTESEQAESLSQRFNQIMLVRAKSAALLVERGYDATEILPA